MSTEKSTAIMLRLVDFSESSCIVTMFTADFGKLSALAKGARRPKGPFESALDLLARCRVVFIHKSSDALDLLTEAKLDRRFRAASRDLDRLYAGYYVAELLDALTDEADPHPELYDAACRTLDALDDSGDVATWVLWFELSLLRVLGHLPSWERCAACGALPDWPERIPFGMLAGGVLCAACRPGQRQIVAMRPEVLRLLGRLSAELPPEDSIPAGCRGEARGLVNQFFANLLGRRPRMSKYLGMLV